MTGLAWLAVCLVSVGLAAVGVGLVARKQTRDAQMAAILGRGAQAPNLDDDDEQSAIVTTTVGLANRLLEQVDTRGGLRRLLEDAKVPVRSGEFAIIVLGVAVAVAAVLALLTHTWWLALVVLVLAPVGARNFLRYRAKARVKAFAAQLPDTLTVLASSLDAGHTFLRSIQMICEESDAPMSEELARVVSETQLGAPLMEALDRLALRIPLRDVEWVVQAIRIQQSVGGRLSELLMTLAEFIRSREEVRLEVASLTAEGRMSAWVVGLIPVVLFIAVQVFNPGYMQPMLQGWGWVWLGLTAVSVVAGLAIIRRMVDGIEV